MSGRSGKPCMVRVDGRETLVIDGAFVGDGRRLHSKVPYLIIPYHTIPHHTSPYTHQTPARPKPIPLSRTRFLPRLSLPARISLLRALTPHELYCIRRLWRGRY